MTNNKVCLISKYIHIERGMHYFMEQAAIGYGVSVALLYCSTSVIYWLISLMLSPAGLFFEFHWSIAFPEQGSHSLVPWYEVSVNLYT